ncbi:hypothetical protein RI129_004822 [Pyrocoelia pectoralis]|uniref:CRAL-TRIO domain-containing protein n=1 Tax=Pyrocoelia pectoralis TaxID=417401 RepID=A0AAN7ZR17_9COLE
MVLLRKLSAELQEVAEGELGENFLRLEEDLEYIREWINKQPHLKARTDDQFLLAFLRGCKFSLQRTQEKLDYYYTAKTIVAELFSNRDPYDPDIQEVLRLGPVLPLPNTAGPEGPRIILLQSSVLNPDKVQYIVFLKVFLMILDILLQEDDNFTVAGVAFWSEGKNSSIRFIMQLTPALLKKIHVIMQKAYPIRLKGVYSTHCPPIAETLFNLSKSFSPEKLTKRMFLYSEIGEEFCKQIPKHLHPKDFGGANGSLEELKSKTNALFFLRFYYLL